MFRGPKNENIPGIRTVSASIWVCCVEFLDKSYRFRFTPESAASTDTKIRDKRVPLPRPLMLALYKSQQRHSSHPTNIHTLRMPHQTTPLTPRQKRAKKAERARKLLAGASLRRDDSDVEDQPWEWIYEKRNSNDEDGIECAEDESGDKVTLKKRKRRNATRIQERRIVGAKTGSFKFKIGDSVLLKAEDGNAPWVGIILEFLEDDEGEMSADFLCRNPKGSFNSQSLI
jgi:hypothetical protein